MLFDIRIYVLWVSIALALMTLAAEATWKPQYANAPANIVQWYAAQYNKNGQWCCDKADGHDFFGDYTLDTDGSVEFDADGVHYHLPTYMVLDHPNPNGHAVWWYTEGVKSKSSYCFAPGAGG